ncbi:hypothetical protein D3C76_1646270 [compost metagenome]
MCGAVLRIAERSFCGVSPVRTAVVMDKGGKPICCNCSVMPASGFCRLIWISLLKALSGET